MESDERNKNISELANEKKKTSTSNDTAKNIFSNKKKELTTIHWK